MARFKNLTAAQRREKRKQARLNKKKAKKEGVFKTARQRRDEAKKRTKRTKKDVGFQPSAESIARKEALEAGNEFEDRFLEIISFLPPDQKERAFSLFSVFRKQSPEQQSALIDELMSVAREEVGPLFDLATQRLREDIKDQQDALLRQKGFAERTFTALKRTVDTNALRAKAKEDRSLAKTLRNITGNAFLGRVAGSGIVKRRTREQVEETGIRKEDIDIAAAQRKESGQILFEQQRADIEAGLARLDVLQERGLRDIEEGPLDLDKGREESAVDVFLKLFESQARPAGQTARANIPTGAIDVLSGLDRTDRTGQSRSDVLFQETDEERRARGRIETATEDERFARTDFSPQELEFLKLGIGFTGTTLGKAAVSNISPEEIDRIPRSLISDILPTRERGSRNKNIILNIGAERIVDIQKQFDDIQSGRARKRELEEHKKRVEARRQARLAKLNS